MIIFESARFKNFLSFGNHWTDINFLDSKKTLVIGSNGAGKSALIDVITFALFSKPFRKINRGGLVNSINKGGLEVELKFRIKNFRYKIIRHQNPGKFEIYVNDVMVPQDASNRDYQKMLENDIVNLNYRTFTQIVVLGSGSYVQFMKLSTSAKREIIEDILDISVFSRMNDLLKTTIKEDIHKLELLEKDKEMHKSQYSFMFEKSQKTNVSKEGRIAVKKDELHRLEVELVEKQAEKDILEGKKPKLECDTPVKQRKTKLTNFKFGIDKNLSIVESEISFYEDNDTCPKCKKVLDSEFKEERVGYLQSKKEEFANALSQINSKIDSVTAKIRELTATKQKYKEFKKELESIESSISSLNYRMNFLKSDIEEINNEEFELISPRELETLKEKVKAADAALKEKYSELSIQKKALEILKDTGAKTSIIKFYLPLINKTINDFLERFDFNVLFMFDENFDETIRARHIDTFRYGNFSEGERMRIDLSLMFTWREIAKKKNSASTNLLFFDEVLDSAMDTAGLDNFMRIIDEFDPEANLYIISHREGVETGFDSVIQAVKENNFSSYVTT